jgi:hypothetical protein
MKTLEFVMGMIIKREKKILESKDIDFLVELLAKNYDRFIKSEDGTGIVFVSDKRVFRIEENLLQIAEQDYQFNQENITNLIDVFEVVSQHFGAAINELGIKITGIKNVECNAFENIMKDKIFNATFYNKVSNFSDSLNGIGIRIVYNKKTWHIDHLIEPYFKDLNHIYEQVDCTINDLNFESFEQIKSLIETPIKIYGINILN